MRNPFVLSGYVSAEYFCDRETETKELTRKLLNSNNVALISPRRVGKTGLIEHCLHQKELEENFYTIYLDIYATSNLQEFVFKLGKEIFESLKPRGKQFIEKFFALISSLRPAFKLDELTGAPIFDVGIGEISKPEFTLEEIFKYLQNADKKCIVAIDEFQQIVNYPEKNIEAVLRTHVQRSTNSVFIFAGSRRQIMQNIFFSSSQPFYQSVSLVSMSAIDIQEYAKFVKRHFENAGKQISEELIALIYNLFEGHTWYLQVIFNELFSLLDKGEDCKFPMVEFVVRNKIFSFEPMFQNTLQLISLWQRELLYAIAKEGKAAGITSRKFIKKHGLKSPSSVQSAANQLLGKEIITSENGIYQVYDRFFGLWLSEVYGTGFKLKIR
ncbi:MAG: ATP-binding protein [Tannerella sp.]|jgi:AAA+ ATPase superfamily predicted ATPase|nr:ATP-binding protein [Tannerella sp.]